MVKIVAIGRGQKKGQKIVVGKGDTEREARWDWFANIVVNDDYPCKKHQQWKLVLEAN